MGEEAALLLEHPLKPHTPPAEVRCEGPPRQLHARTHILAPLPVPHSKVPHKPRPSHVRPHPMHAPRTRIILPTLAHMSINCIVRKGCHARIDRRAVRHIHDGILHPLPIPTQQEPPPPQAPMWWGEACVRPRGWRAAFEARVVHKPTSLLATSLGDGVGRVGVHQGALALHIPTHVPTLVLALAQDR